MADKTDRKYTAEHEWLDIVGTTATIGITDYAAEKLGDVVFVELPKQGATVQAGKVVGEIESTKSVGELFAPVDDPFGEGWMIKLEVADAAAFDAAEFMTFDAYNALVGE